MKNRLSNKFVLAPKAARLVAPLLLAQFLVLTLARDGAAQTARQAPARTNPQAAAQTAATDWTGSYYFDDRPPTPKNRDELDVVPRAAYDITIEKRADGKLAGTFSANGVQIFDAFECSFKAVSDKKVEVYFEKIAVEDVPNRLKLEPGDLLFSLVKTGVGKTTKYLYEPGEYKIVRAISSQQKSSVYFVKQ